MNVKEALYALDLHPVVLVLAVLLVVLAAALLILAHKHTQLRRRLDGFTGGKVRPDVTLEQILSIYAEDVRGVKAHTSQLLQRVGRLEDNMVYCAQKVGVVRYNPFEETGGNLCFAVALLDGNDDGLILNGIYSRTGTYVYAKPVEMGVSLYVLSEEEKQALAKAKAAAFAPEEPEKKAD